MYSASPSKARLAGAVARILLAATAAACLAGSALLVSSCARKREAEAVKPSEDSRGKQGGAAPALQASRTPQTPPAQGDKRTEPKPPAQFAASLRGFGLGAPSVPRMPEDFSLGPLQSYRPVAGDEAAAFTVAKSFMDEVAAGRLDDKLLLPEARDALSVLLAPPAPAKAETAAPAESGSEAASAEKPAPPPPGGLGYRLGAITMMGDDASLLVRMPRADAGAAREEGLLSLRKVEGAWYVQALALRPADAAALAFAAGERNARK